MEVLLGAVMGLIVGASATRTHPRVDPGLPLGMLAGLIGGLLGQHWAGGPLTSLLAEQTLAGAAAGGTLGGLVIAPLAGVVVTLTRDRHRRARLARGLLPRAD